MTWLFQFAGRKRPALESLTSSPKRQRSDATTVNPSFWIHGGLGVPGVEESCWRPTGRKRPLDFYFDAVEEEKTPPSSPGRRPQAAHLQPHGEDKDAGQSAIQLAEGFNNIGGYVKTSLKEAAVSMIPDVTKVKTSAKEAAVSMFPDVTKVKTSAKQVKQRIQSFLLSPPLYNFILASVKYRGDIKDVVMFAIPVIISWYVTAQTVLSVYWFWMRGWVQQQWFALVEFCIWYWNEPGLDYWELGASSIDLITSILWWSRAIRGFVNIALVLLKPWTRRKFRKGQLVEDVGYFCWVIHNIGSNFGHWYSEVIVAFPFVVCAGLFLKHHFGSMIDTYIDRCREIHGQVIEHTPQLLLDYLRVSRDDLANPVVGDKPVRVCAFWFFENPKQAPVPRSQGFGYH